MALGGTGLVRVAIAIATAIWAWILGLKMRHRIKRAPGIKVDNEVELTSLETWMKVENAEERSKGGKLS